MHDSNQARAKVLFVDDEPDLTRGIRRALRREPYEILVANSPTDALELLARQEVDVVVSDERMPDMGGAEFLTRVRELYPETVRMVLTGQSTLDAAASAINDAGVYRFLLKPCSPRDLAASVQKAIDERAQQRQYEAWVQQVDGRSTTELEAAFERARNSLWMAFQPIVRAQDSRTVAYESLMRSTDHELASPDALIEVADRIGRVVDLDMHILDLIANRLPDAPLDASVFVNVHPKTLMGGWLSTPKNPLARHAERVVIEVTERSSLEDVDALKTQVRELRNMGFRIALDDMGAGYAGLTSFALLIPEVVKFDMELIRGIESSPAKKKLIGAMTQLCRELNMTTIAEGVETQSEWDHACNLGCDLIQGYFHSKPSPEFQDFPCADRTPAA